MKLKDKVIVITGSSQGFGEALAFAFKNEGAIVIISSNDSVALKKTSEKLSTDSLVADVTKKDNLEKLSKYVVGKYKQIDIWVNNAGIQIAPSLTENIEVEKLQNLFNINYFGYFYGCQVALRLMKQQNNGLIININSTAGLDGKANLSAYSSSKFAIKGLTESIRKEISGSNIKIHGVFPGGMQTDIYKEKIPQDINEYMKVEYAVEKVINNLKSNSPEEDLVIKRPLK